MNRKIQDSDALFIAARYKRDRHAFNAVAEAAKYGVSLRTIHSVLSRAGIKMRRGRKPIQAPPAPLISPPASVEPLNPLDMLNLVNHLNHPKPPVGPKPPLSPRFPVKPRRGPPIIRPNTR